MKDDYKKRDFNSNICSALDDHYEVEEAAVNHG